MVGRDTEGTCQELLCGWILCLHGDQHKAPECAFPARFLCSQACLERGVCLEHAPHPPTLDRGWLLKALSGQLRFA